MKIVKSRYDYKRFLRGELGLTKNNTFVKFVSYTDAFSIEVKCATSYFDIINNKNIFYRNYTEHGFYYLDTASSDDIIYIIDVQESHKEKI